MLQAGAAVDSQQGVFQLHRASAGVSQARASADILQHSPRAVLERASENGHERLVQILLEAGTRVNAPGGRHGTALNREPAPCCGIASERRCNWLKFGIALVTVLS